MKNKVFPILIHPFICNLFFAFFIVITALPGRAQTVIVSEDMRQQTDKRFGPGRKHYRHMFTGLHFVAGPSDEGAEILYGRSQVYEFGMRYKRQFHPVYSAGYDVKLKRMAFFLRQQESKLVPGPELFDKEKLIYVAAGLVLYQRFNYGRRGNYIGRFIDMGAYGDWYFHTRHISFYEEGGQKVRARRTSLDYPAMLGYGVLLRFGFNHIVLTGSYRMSDMFDKADMMPELPRFVFGLEMGMHSR